MRWKLPVLIGAVLCLSGVFLAVLPAQSQADADPFAEGAVRWSFHAASGKEFSSQVDDDEAPAALSHVLNVFYALTNGVGIVYWGNGERYITCTVSNCVLTGSWSVFHSNGQQWMSGTYDTNGAKDSCWTTWYANGKKSTESYYRAGVPSGMWCTWHTNGYIASVSAYVNGVPEGKILAWDSTGEIIHDIWTNERPSKLSQRALSGYGVRQKAPIKPAWSRE